MNLYLPLMSLAIVVPLLGGAGLLFAPSDEKPRTAAAIIAGLTLFFVALIVSSLFDPSAAEPSLPDLLLPSLFAIDWRSAALLGLTALVTLALVLAAPRRDLSTRTLGALLLTEAATLGLFSARPVELMIGFAVAALLPSALLVPRPKRLAPGRLRALLRLLPFHGGLSEFFASDNLALAVLLSVTRPALYVAIRLLLPHAQPELLLGLSILALITGLHASLIGVSQGDLRRTLAAIVRSQSGIILAGLCAGNIEGSAAALVQWLGFGVGLTGLALCVWAVEARAGTVELGSLGGLVHKRPRLAAAFLVLAVACVGFPGTVGFVAEDILVHGLLGSHPVVAAGLILVTALNGITVIRAFASAFLGPESRPLSPPDLLPREQGVLVLLIIVLLGVGTMPAALVRSSGDFAAHELGILETELPGSSVLPAAGAGR